MAVDGSSYLMVKKNKFAFETESNSKENSRIPFFHNVPLRCYLENIHGNRMKFGFEIKQLKPILCGLFWYIPLHLT